MTAAFALLLSVICSALGFGAGIALATSVEEVRSHPRYLIVAGGVLVVAGLVLGGGARDHAALYYLVLFLMMAGIGATAAGWEAEQEWDVERANVRRERMRSIREQMLRRPDEPPSWEQPNADRPQEPVDTSGA